jgi:phage terminase large subunit-like protein
LNQDFDGTTRRNHRQKGVIMTTTNPIVRALAAVVTEARHASNSVVARPTGHR